MNIDPTLPSDDLIIAETAEARITHQMATLARIRRVGDAVLAAMERQLDMLETMAAAPAAPPIEKLGRTFARVAQSIMRATTLETKLSGDRALARSATRTVSPMPEPLIVAEVVPADVGPAEIGPVQCASVEPVSGDAGTEPVVAAPARARPAVGLDARIEREARVAEALFAQAWQHLGVTEAGGVDVPIAARA